MVVELWELVELCWANIHLPHPIPCPGELLPGFVGTERAGCKAPFPVFGLGLPVLFCRKQLDLRRALIMISTWGNGWVISQASGMDIRTQDVAGRAFLDSCATRLRPKPTAESIQLREKRATPMGHTAPAMPAWVVPITRRPFICWTLQTWLGREEWAIWTQVSIAASQRWEKLDISASGWNRALGHAIHVLQSSG